MKHQMKIGSIWTWRCFAPDGKLKWEDTNSPAEFSINATKTLYGGALVGGGTGADTKADTAGGGTLIFSAQFSGGSKSVGSGDTVSVTVTVSSSDV